MIIWYRPSFPSNISPQITVPTLLLWEKLDQAHQGSSYDMAQLSMDFCDDGQLITFEEASHWGYQDEPNRFNQLMIDQFKKE